MNATGHRAHGDGAARIPAPDLKHTALGYGPHHAAAIIWAGLFEHLREGSQAHCMAAASRDALISAATAAVIDYTITPYRLTPGWELVLSKRSMAGGGFRCHGASGEATAMAPSSLQPTDGAPYATAPRLEQISICSRTRCNIDRGD
jgi:hypothetical protein